MRISSRPVRAAVLVCLLASAAVACGDTNNINQHTGRDGKICVDDAACPEAAPPQTPDAATGASSPGTDAGSGDSGADGAEPASPAATDASSRVVAGAGSTAQVRVRYLTETGPIGGYHNNEREDVEQLGDATLPHSIVFSPGVFAKDVEPLSFNVPSGLTRFQATLGLDGNTLPDYEAHVGVRRRDGTTVADVTLKGGEVHTVSEGLAGADMITIDVEIVKWASDAINSRPHVVVGDGRFVR